MGGPYYTTEISISGQKVQYSELFEKRYICDDPKDSEILLELEKQIEECKCKIKEINAVNRKTKRNALELKLLEEDIKDISERIDELVEELYDKDKIYVINVPKINVYRINGKEYINNETVAYISKKLSIGDYDLVEIKKFTEDLTVMTELEKAISLRDFYTKECERIEKSQQEYKNKSILKIVNYFCTEFFRYNKEIETFKEYRDRIKKNTANQNLDEWISTYYSIETMDIITEEGNIVQLRTVKDFYEIEEKLSCFYRNVDRDSKNLYFVENYRYRVTDEYDNCDEDDSFYRLFPLKIDSIPFSA